MSETAPDLHHFASSDQEHKKAIAQRFGEAASVYDQKAQVQKQVSQAALSMLQKSVCQPVGSALDIGCGTGLDTVKLLSFAKSVTGCDLSEGMINFAANNNQNTQVNWAVGDAENIPLADNSVDLMYSSMALQWLPDTHLVAQECFRVLSKGGTGVIAVVLQDSLFELRNSWLKLDPTPSVNQFLPGYQWLNAFRRSGFDAQLEQQVFTTLHRDIFKVLHSMKDVGAGVVLHHSAENQPVGREAPTEMMNKTKLKSLNRIYRKDYQRFGELPLSWNIGFLTFRKAC